MKTPPRPTVKSATRKSATRPRAAAKPSPKRVRAAALPVDGRLRVVVERVAPEIDAGRFPIKRTAGEAVDVTAHVHADGHDVVRAVVRSRLMPADGTPGEWLETPMQPLGNDEWGGRFVVEAEPAYEYTVHGWIDRFATWQKELRAKVDAGQDVSSELLEGAGLVQELADRVRPSNEADAHWLEARAELLAGTADMQERARDALDDQLAHLNDQVPDRSRTTEYERTLRVSVDRERARVGAWYEMFPRSWGPDPTRSATFREAANHLTRVAEMGFDVVYLPPIHPIGTSFRKGPGNSLEAQPGDPGSPWAIGSEAGGHKAVDPGLGTLDDFAHFLAEARRLGLEVALDLAYQCSPDHPYVREHPEWFRHRPDGTIKYAENPPKKYQDIYPFDFECEAWPELWNELKSVVEFWIAQGVLIFRVDNPHTKPYRFWEWMIGEFRREHPDAIFLAEAFTRPKMMYYLAKLGFTQSYTYFTWRNSKSELTDYFSELTRTEVVEFFRPNLFANTPDILHAYLQHGGRAAFEARLMLAATLGANYGIYSGFELAESRAVPGTEEYHESEKYQFRQWDWEKPGHIRDLVTTVNRIRHENPALHGDRSLRFHETDNPQLIAYSKRTIDDTNLLLMIVNLDPHNMQHGLLRVPTADFGLAGYDAYGVEDLLDGSRYTWRGEYNYVRLDPGVRPAHVLRIR
jgi:starch synthase (maltosyl-transferring)